MGRKQKTSSLLQLERHPKAHTMEGKCGMQIRVLLVTRSYADAIYMKNLLPWEQLGFQLLIELNSISGLQKVSDLHPQVLMLFGSLGAADLDLFLEYSQKKNLRLYIIILPNKQQQVDELVTETANSGTAQLYFVPKLTDGTLLKVLEDIRTTQLSATPSSVISGSLPENEKSSLVQLQQSLPDAACNLLWLHLDAVPILMRRQIESVLSDHAQEGRLRWLRWRQDILLILVSLEEGEEQAEVITKWLMDGNFGNTQLLFAGPLRAEEMENAVVRLQRLDGLHYFTADVRFLHENSDIAHPKMVYPDLFSILVRLLLASLRDEEKTATQQIRELYLRQIKPSMSFAILQLGRHMLHWIYQILSGSNAEPAEQPTEQFHSIEDEMQFAIASWEAFLKKRKPVPLLPSVEKTLEYLHANYASNIGLKKLADELNTSESSLSKQFKQQVGCGIVAYRTHLRVYMAALMLLQSTRPVSQVAEKTGFWDVKYFSRVFRKIMGESPAQYRKLAGEKREGESLI